MLTYMAMSVATLGKRLEALLSLGYHLLMLSEVRVSEAQQRSLSRVAKSLGYSCVWSKPPHSGPTFSVLPGGVALFAKEPIALRKLPSPHVDHWDNEGRAVAASLLYEVYGSSQHVVVMYGYPVSHSAYRTHEDMMIQISSWISSLTVPVIWGGDFNLARTSPPFLSSLALSSLWRVSGDQPSTMSRKGGISHVLPIDHIIVNHRMLDQGLEAQCFIGHL